MGAMLACKFSSFERGSMFTDSLALTMMPVGKHDSNMLDEDRMLLFDNNPRKSSRAVIYRIDDVKRTATLVSSYMPRFGENMIGSFAMRSARRTLDGSGFVPGLELPLSRLWNLGAERASRAPVLRWMIGGLTGCCQFATLTRAKPGRR